MDGTVEFRFIVLLHYLIIIITKKNTNKSIGRRTIYFYTLFQSVPG